MTNINLIKPPTYEDSSTRMPDYKLSRSTMLQRSISADTIAEYLEGQLIPNTLSTAPMTQEHYARIEEKVSTFMATLLSTIPGDLFL
ncbi:hypothetical protein EVAR_15849_1 [Eumeta japonica]|uniref:Uncharacterized protein n=1 Tax=Eumeta variegata TaxID=151549 RepID=A0A4C1UDU5_EUMVA|nr:hypothetical protein EVAR_15849_1 [Eumeta japonica]